MCNWIGEFICTRRAYIKWLMRAGSLKMDRYGAAAQRGADGETAECVLSKTFVFCVSLSNGAEQQTLSCRRWEFLQLYQQHWHWFATEHSAVCWSQEFCLAERSFPKVMVQRFFFCSLDLLGLFMNSFAYNAEHSTHFRLPKGSSKKTRSAGEAKTKKRTDEPDWHSQPFPL